MRITRELGPLLPAIILIVHAVKGKRLDLRARGYVKIGIFVPSIRVEEEFADAPDWPWRQRTRREFQGQFIPAIHQDERLIARANQLRDVPVARTPAVRCYRPIRVRADGVVIRRERPIGRQILQRAEAAEVQIGFAGCDERNRCPRVRFLFHQRDAIPVSLEGLGQTQPARAWFQFPFKIHKDCFGFSSGGAGRDVAYTDPGDWTSFVEILVRAEDAG